MASGASSDQSGDGFDRAVADAVAAGRSQIESLDAVATALEEDYAALVKNLLGLGAGEVGLEFQTRKGHFISKLRQHLAHQHDVLSSFNIAFFGRTGAGKSTLLSAFGELDGSAVSPGESDFTMEAHSIDWRGCKLFDTPGINGWGRSKSRAELEAEARRAVEVADVVLLCFDTQSQQNSEFGKVAEWVHHFGKPTIAVLNNRNLRWRHPAKVPEQRARRNISEPVRQHVSNIRGELANIGLHDTPVVVLHSRRALFARASTPYRGPGEADFTHERDTYGLEYLARWSNFGALEDLICAGVTAGGAEMRLTSLREGMRALLRDEGADLTRLANELEKRIAELDRAVILQLETLGYLEDDERDRYLHDDEWCGNLLTLAEASRGVPYRSPAEGTFSRQARNLAKAHLATPRSNAMGRFRNLERDAFDKRENVDEKRFLETVFEQSEISAALSEVWAQASKFLDHELSVAAAELNERNTAGHAKASVQGDAGSSNETMENLLRAGSLLSGGAGTVALGLTLANIWNPAGWVGGAVLAGVGVVGSVMQWLGESMGEDAEKQRAEARAAAFSAGISAVHDTFDRIEKRFSKDARAVAWQAVAPDVRNRLRDFLALSSLRSAVIEVEQRLDSAAASIPESPQHSIFAVAARAERTLLGEDWFDQDSLTLDRAVVEDERLETFFQERHDHDVGVLSGVLSEAFSRPEPSGLKAWSERIALVANEDPIFINVLRALPESPGMPTMAVIGDYSSGKSSLIKRLMVEFKGSAPESLAIRADPTTAEGHRYHVAGFDLVDTPGFQSGREGHDDLALSAAEDAALVIVLFQVNLMIGDTTRLEGVVKGTDRSAGIWPRMLFLINRCDEIGVDPEHIIAEYFGRVDRKASELYAALDSRGIGVDESHIHGIASDPFGAIGQQWPVAPEDYASHRRWDGIAAVVEALRSLPPDTLMHGQAIAAFDRSRSRLMDARVRLEDEVEICQSESDKHDSVIRTLKICLEDADYLAKSLELSLSEKITRRTTRTIEAIRCLKRGDTKKLSEHIASWPGSDVAVEVDRFMASAEEQITDWAATHQSAINREFEAAQFAAAVNVSSGKPPGWLGDGESAKGARNASRLAGSAQKMFAGLGNRGAAYAIGKRFSVKFKPWGAVKAGRTVARVGIVLQVAAVGLDVASWVRVKQQREKWEGIVDRAETEVLGASQVLVDKLLRDDEGPLSYLAERRREIEGLLDETRAGQAALKSEIESCQRRVALIDELLAEADGLRRG